jgi:dephospho-CoA kinase
MSGPFVLGLTGSIGMGKSTVAGMFEDLGIPVFHADRVVSAMQGPGGSVVPAIEAAFPGTTGAEGIDRVKVGDAVFGDPAALSRLEAIVHPAVRAARREFLREHAGARLVVLDIPLLFERGGVEEVEAALVVSAPPEMQRERVLRRPGMTAERFERILALQLPDAEKRARADYVIDTTGPLDETRAQVARLVEKLTG